MRKFHFLLFVVVFLSCKDPLPCSKLEYENGLTTLNGKKFSGKCNTFYNDFKIRSVQQYKEGRDDKKWTFYFNNGNIQTEGSFSDGKRIGEWKYYYESGKIWKVNHYKNGEKTGDWVTYSQDGEIQESIIFD